MTAAALIDATRQLLECLPRWRLSPFMAGWPNTGSLRDLAPTALPVLRWLDDTRTGMVPLTASLVELLGKRSLVD